MKFIKSISIFIVIFLLLSISSKAENSVIRLNAQSSVASAKTGQKFFIRLTCQLKKPYHTYTLKEQINSEGVGPSPTEITLLPKELIALDGKIISPKPRVEYDSAFMMKVEFLQNNFTFDLPVRAKKDISSIHDKIIVSALMQFCNNSQCLPPDEYKVQVAKDLFKPDKSLILAIEIDSTAGKPTSQTAQAPVVNTPQNTNVSNTISQAEKANTAGSSQPTSFWSALIVAMAAGALALLTPCVFPMVPITVSFFTRRVEQQKGTGLRDASVYALGIIASFTSLGFIFSAIFGASGIQNFINNPWVSLAIAVVFLVFAFNLLGAYELQVPTGLMNKLNAKSQQGNGMFSVILMALTFSLASFSCTGPLIAGALVAASNGQWFYPIISMLGFSTVLAAPFFLLALFPTALNSMPRAGGWMNNLKVVLGLVVIAISFKYINGALAEWDIALTRDVFLSIWIGVTFLITIYILGVFKMSHDSPVESIGSVRIVFAILFATVMFYLISGFSGKQLGTLEAYIPSPETTEATTTINKGSTVKTEPETVWLEDFNQALQLAKTSNKPIFVDFSGKHCANCRIMERTMFPKGKVIDLMNKFVKVRLITDILKEPFTTNKKMQIDRFQSVALPLYVILSPNNELIASQAYTSDESEFLAFLKKGIKE